MQQCERLNNWLQTCLTFFAETRHCFGFSLHREHWKHSKRLKSCRISLTYEQAFWIFLLFGHWAWTACNTNMRKIYLIFNRCFLWNDAYYSGPCNKMSIIYMTNWSVAYPLLYGWFHLDSCINPMYRFRNCSWMMSLKYFKTIFDYTLTTAWIMYFAGFWTLRSSEPQRETRIL